MRVVCDNCGAVYKIANNKLTKEVNRATCKRCGHKIIIYKPGSRAAEEAAAASAAPASADSDEERTVIKSVPELEKIASQQGVPSIGSLTAELRAISIPGIQSVSGPAPKAPDTLGPVGPTEGETKPPPPAIAPLPTPPGASAGPAAAGPTPAPAVIPATAIPPSDSPATKVYDGPAPAVAPAGTGNQPKPAAPGGAADSTRPMPLPTVPTNGGAGPSLGSVPSPSPSPTMGAGPIPARATSVPAASPSSATAVTSVKVSASPVLGAVGLFAGFGLVGLIGSAAGLAWPISLVFYGLTALGVTACLCLAMLTGRGRHPQRSPVALILAFFLTIVLVGVHYAAANVKPAPQPEPAAFRPAPATKPAPPAPAVTPAPVEEPAAADSATGGGLDTAELEEARKYSTRDVASLGSTTGGDSWSEPTPAKESKADVVTRPPPAERRATTTPKPPKKEEPTPAPRASSSPGPSRPALSEPSGGSASAKSDGPSPFVIDTIIRNNAAIVRCLRVEEAKGVDLSGKIYLKFTIAPEGAVSKARVTTSRFAGTALDTCISRELNSLSFPPFEGTAKKITYPLIVQ